MVVVVVVVVVGPLFLSVNEVAESLRLMGRCMVPGELWWGE